MPYVAFYHKVLYPKYRLMLLFTG